MHSHVDDNGMNWYNTFPMSETFEKSQMSEFFDVSSGC